MATADQLQLGMAGQLARFEGALRGGMPRAGWKVGLNFPEVRAAVGVSDVVVAWIDGARVLRSGAALPVPTDARLHVEAEICLRVAHGIAADAGPDVAWQGIDVMPTRVCKGFVDWLGTKQKPALVIASSAVSETPAPE